MSIYSEILIAAMEGRDPDLADNALLDHALSCRAALHSGHEGTEGRVDTRLAAELAYDRALIWLAHSLGIDATARDFSRPRIARQRLERALTDKGIDVESLAAKRS